MRELYNNDDIVIKPADKGCSIVKMDTNPDHYERLLEDPTQKFNTHINSLINQAWRLNIIDESTYNNLQTKNPRIPTFYLLPKIHKKGNPDIIVRVPFIYMGNFPPYVIYIYTIVEVPSDR